MLYTTFRLIHDLVWDEASKTSFKINFYLLGDIDSEYKPCFIFDTASENKFEKRNIIIR